MRYRFLRYPGGKAKAVTFSYDDGVCYDVRLVEMLNRYGIKCTFNLNSGMFPAEPGQRRLTVQDVKETLLPGGHEIANHGHLHIAPGNSRPIDTIQDVLNCRLGLEKEFGGIIRGYAYPDSGITRFHNGANYAQIRQNLVDLGIAYARTLSADNNSFQLPTDWYAWVPTTRHANPNALSWAREFVDLNVDSLYGAHHYPRLFYLWGHSYEFNDDNNWDLLELLCQTLGGKEDIWYATNIEICDYVHAYDSLIFSADGKRVYNPTLVKIWFLQDGKPYTIDPGQTLEI